MKTELCRFSGAKIYPGRGIRFVRSDSQVVFKLTFGSQITWSMKYSIPVSIGLPSIGEEKVISLPGIDICALYLSIHLGFPVSQFKIVQDDTKEAVKKRRRTTKKPYSRSIVGATLEVIQKKRTEKPEVRDAAREAALREIKERIKKTKDEKKAKKAEVTAKAQKAGGKGNMPKGGAAKGPKLGGGGGKR
ncbi:hypothetical protein RHSIM_Rhsim03G0084600 [Rhododendron simsii]|uniref:Large ribosomal subunit protein eL24-related N-terminal domain-containing protein n=1 Tax=Rhododendron simsii TaxID=118357 RepID=A0A834LPP7_RHOSS|nr:hypothetical protein RHSIM_Rhsim03G0084600 [Rhododendron simsii]